MLDGMKATIANALADVKGWSAYTLADKGDCSTPDNRESEGAQFLNQVRDATVEMIEYRIDDIEDSFWFDHINDDGTVNEIADGAPSIYTRTVWEQFVDLGAYMEDPTELGFDGSEMEKAAGICLYMIAERLAYAVLGYVKECIEEWEEEQVEDVPDIEDFRP